MNSIHQIEKSRPICSKIKEVQKMAGIVKTWNHKNLNINFNLTEITDLNGDFTITLILNFGNL